MLAGVSQFTGNTTGSVAKGPKGKLSEGSKKVGQGAVGATGKAMGMSATKAKRPGK